MILFIIDYVRENNKINPFTITVEETANFLGVSNATVYNWIKTKYLKQTEVGKITLGSLNRFRTDIFAKEKLNQRANKSLKDSHDHDKTASVFLERIKSSIYLPDNIGIEYEKSLSDSYRNKEGIYYTPDQVVRDLFSEEEGDIQDASLCDPCCGSGNFIIRAINLGFKPENVYGYDVDPVAVEMTKKRIYELTGYKSKNIKWASFLDVSIDQDPPIFDCIYTNPPWGKKIAKKKRESIGLRLGAGHSLDTCSLFFFACLKCLKTNGLLGLLLPESFFNIAVFEDARIKALKLSIERLIDYGKVFDGLVTKAQAIVLRNKLAEPSLRVSCQTKKSSHQREINSFLGNPKSILNMYCNDKEALTLQYLMSKPFITLKNQAFWGLGIVTGNNKKFIKNKPEEGDVPVYKGADVFPDKLKEASSFISSDMSLYQQVAPLHLYEAREKLIYKFISSKLCFFYDDKQKYILNSANMLIPNDSFPISTKVLGELLSSNFMNWMFSRIFCTHKILRGDLELLPIYSQFLRGVSVFDEKTYIEQLNIKREVDGAYRIKR